MDVEKIIAALEKYLREFIVYLVTFFRPAVNDEIYDDHESYNKRAVFSFFAAPLAAVLIAVPAAYAKSDITKLKAKCTVVAVVFGTGWDVLGGSSTCSMLTDTAKADASTAKRSLQATKKTKGKG